MAMNGAGGAGADEESILSLLEHFKDDGKVGLLVKELQELSTRVQTAELATIVNPRRGGEKLRGIDAFANAVRRVRHQLPSGSITGMGSAAGGSRDASVSGAEAGTAAGGAAANNDNNNSGVSGAAGVRGGRVEEAILPVPPEETSQPLPAPTGGHEWEALQAAVNDSVAAFGAAAAKMGWKKWALTRAHSVLLVSLFWWVVATAFKSDHPLSRPLQDFAFGHFCRHYVTVVLQLRGKARDQYQQVWIEMMAAASLYLLAEVFPRSQHKFDEGLRALITKQLRLFRSASRRQSLNGTARSRANTAAGGLGGFGHGGGSDGEGGGSAGPQAFVFTKNSPLSDRLSGYMQNDLDKALAGHPASSEPYPVGTKDTRRRKMAATILHGLDLEQYAV
eukprot:XP_001691340.1 predicted protein [Chlamydomonas reinhardtii]